MNCTCGADKHGWPHSRWCPLEKVNWERRRCAGFDGPCDREGPEVQPELSRTRYHWNGNEPDPNAPIPLCRSCARAHHDHWDRQWAEYYAMTMPNLLP